MQLISVSFAFCVLGPLLTSESQRFSPVVSSRSFSVLVFWFVYFKSVIRRTGRLCWAWSRRGCGSVGGSVQGPPPQLERRVSSRIVVTQQVNLEGYMGFANLPNQVYKNQWREGLNSYSRFCINQLITPHGFVFSRIPRSFRRIKKTAQVEQSKVLTREDDVQLLLTIADAPEFGDVLQPVIGSIGIKSEDYLSAESQVNRRQMLDNEMQCCWEEGIAEW